MPDAALLERLLVGVDPMRTEAVREVFETVDFHGGRPWTVEVAIWDLVGRLLGQPLWRLLGGRSERLIAYASTAEPVGAEERARRVDRAARPRRAGGEAALPSRRLASRRRGRRAGAGRGRPGLRGHGRRQPGLAHGRRSLRALGRRDRHANAPARSSRSASTGSRSRCGPTTSRATRCCAAARRFASLPERWCAACSRPAISSCAAASTWCSPTSVLAGGLGGCRRIAALADLCGRAFSPHTWTNGFGLLANLHLAAAVSTCPYIEVPFDPPGWTPDRRDWLLGGPTIEIAPTGRSRRCPAPGWASCPTSTRLEEHRVA